MINRRRRVVAVVVVCVVICYGGFSLLGMPCRRIESTLALLLLGRPRWVTSVASLSRPDRGPGQTAHVRLGTYSPVFKVATWHQPVTVSFTTYLSSLIALMAVGCCGLYIVRAPRPRRYGAVAISVSTVVVFSSLRLVGSFLLIRVFGGSAGWLFEDWFGILLVLVDTALGYHLLIWLLLPRKRPP